MIKLNDLMKIFKTDNEDIYNDIKEFDVILYKQDVKIIKNGVDIKNINKDLVQEYIYFNKIRKDFVKNYMAFIKLKYDVSFHHADYFNTDDRIDDILYEIEKIYKKILIEDIIKDVNSYNSVTELFTQGYCYDFAKILKNNYDKGKIYFIKNKKHYVFTPDDFIFYDINGEYPIDKKNDILILD